MTDSKIVVEMTRDDWSESCEKNGDKWHIRNIQIKYKIIIIVQYTLTEDVAFDVQSQTNYVKTVSITHPFSFHCGRNNKPLCIITNHLIW